MKYDLRKEAEYNFARLCANPYPGRGLVAGIMGQFMVQMCWIMGRSANSRNRIYRSEGGRVFTDLARPDPNANTDLTIYDAMDEVSGRFVASNGRQTSDLVAAVKNRLSFGDSLKCWTYEPDAPNYTARITVVCCADIALRSSITFSAIRKFPNQERCFRGEYVFDVLESGIGTG